MSYANRTTASVIQNFLTDHKVEKGDEYNIIDALHGIKSYIDDAPWSPPESYPILAKDRSSIASKIDYLFYLLDKAYREGTVLHICERQYYTIGAQQDSSIDGVNAAGGATSADSHVTEIRKFMSIGQGSQGSQGSQSSQSSQSNPGGSLDTSYLIDDLGDDLSGNATSAHMDAAGADDAAADENMAIENFLNRNIKQPNGNNTKPRVVDRCCTEWDFDIYQTSATRLITPNGFKTIIERITVAMANIIDFSNPKLPTVARKDSEWVRYTAAIISKEAPRPVTNRKILDQYQNHSIWKDSFRIRTYIQLTKAEKNYVRAKLLTDDRFNIIFRDTAILNKIEELVDKGTFSNPIMFLGSAKRDSNIISDIHSIFDVYFTQGNGGIVVDELQPVHDIGKVPEIISGKKPKDKPITVFRYIGNLPYELSLGYSPYMGRIKKITVPIRPELAGEINQYATVSHERGNLEVDLNQINEQIRTICVGDNDAKFINALIGCISKTRAVAYLDWRRVIVGLASASRLYKPLAIKFSMLEPHDYQEDRDKLLRIIDDIWESTHMRRASAVASDDAIKILCSWAKADNFALYKSITGDNLFNIVKEGIIRDGGHLTDHTAAKALKSALGDMLFCTTTTVKNTPTWYMFRMPETVNKYDKNVSLYKWSRCDTTPLLIHHFITRTLYNTVATVSQHIEQTVLPQLDRERDKDKIEKYTKLIAALSTVRTGLYTNRPYPSIVSYASRELGRENIVSQLDNNEYVKDYLGVANGVLQLQPTVKLIQGYHDILITRSTKCDYEPYNPQNRLHIEVEANIDKLFDMESCADAAMFMKMVLSLCLSGQARTPSRFYLLWGEGSNGKSFIMELHSNTLGDVSSTPHGGYSNNMNLTFLTDGLKGGPDTMLMSNEHARCIYITEGYPGMKVRMENVKRLTDKVSGNEKFERQKVIKINSDVFFASNYNPTIAGRDHGTWRRLVVIEFTKHITSTPDPNNPMHVMEDPTLLSQKVHDRAYQSAYLAVLVKYYTIFMQRYYGDVAKLMADCPSINTSTKRFRESQDYVYKFYATVFIHRVGAKSIGFEKIKERFVTWCKTNRIYEYDVEGDMNYMKKLAARPNGKQVTTMLHDHIMLDPGQTTEEYLESEGKVTAAQSEAVDSDFEDLSNMAQSDNESDDPDGVDTIAGNKTDNPSKTGVDYHKGGNTRTSEKASADTPQDNITDDF